MKQILFLGFIFLLLLIPLFYQGLYRSHDGINHVVRISAYYNSLREGNVLPRWASQVNYGYGSPLFIFFYPLPYLVGSFFHFLSFSLENSFKIVMGLSFFIAPFCFYFWSRLVFERKASYISAFFYGLAPYHILNIYVRGDFGEVMSFIFIPLVLYAIEKYIQKRNILFILIGGIFYASLILSHPGIALMFSPVFFAYILIRGYKSIRYMVNSFFVLFLGLFLSSFFWLPVFLESKFINSTLFENVTLQHFSSFYKLIHSPWGFGADVVRSGGLSPQLGIAPFLVVVLSIFVFAKFKRCLLFWFFLGIFFAGIFFSTPYSSFLYGSIGFLKKFQFPWRFMALSSFAAASLSGLILSSFHKNIKNIILAFLLITTIPLVKVDGYLTFKDAYYEQFSGTTFYRGEATSRWTQGDAGSFAKSPVEIIVGIGEVTNFTKRSHEQIFVVQAKNQVRILDNTVYFPGWQVFVDKRKVPIEFQDINHRGLITFVVPKGIRKVDMRFVESPIRLFSDTVSLFAFFAFSIGFLFHRRFDRLLVKL